METWREFIEDRFLKRKREEAGDIREEEERREEERKIELEAKRRNNEGRRHGDENVL